MVFLYPDEQMGSVMKNDVVRFLLVIKINFPTILRIMLNLEKIKEIINPVSYTHLDVYKRQSVRFITLFS